MTSLVERRMAQTLKIGKHELELLIDPKAQGVALEEYKFERTRSASYFWDDWSWVFWLMVIAGLYFLATS